MRAAIAILLAVSLSALTAFPAYAAHDDVTVRGRAEIRLGDFEIIIGDLGHRYDAWDYSPTRVEVEVMDGWRSRMYYFDSLPAALFVLRQMYNAPQLVSLYVPDYDGDRLINGFNSYYVWDYDHYSRGGLPLIISFGSYRDAQREARYRNGVILDFKEVVSALYDWADRDYRRIYWRGWDRERWNDDRWDRAWHSRWQGWGWDRDRGWSKVDSENSRARVSGDRKYKNRDTSGNERVRVNVRTKDTGRDSQQVKPRPSQKVKDGKGQKAKARPDTKDGKGKGQKAKPHPGKGKKERGGRGRK